MADGEDKKAGSQTLLNAYVGMMNPAEIVEKQDRNGKPYAVGKFHVTGPDKVIDVYAFGKNAETLREKAATGEPFFIQGESLARGTGLSVSSFEPKTYEATVVKIYANGSNDYGDWAATRLAIEGMGTEKQAMLSGKDARAVLAAGEGGKISFEGAWKPELNEQSKKWYSRLVSAGSVGRAPRAPAPEDDMAPGM